MNGVIKGFKWNENLDWATIDEKDVDTSTVYGKLVVAAIRAGKKQYLARMASERVGLKGDTHDAR